MEQFKSSGYIEYGGIGETNADYRARLMRQHAEAVERRQSELQQQSSPNNDPQTRIRLWERLHQIDLPRNPAHRLIAIIAANTGLTTSEVLAEQQTRVAALVPPKSST